MKVERIVTESVAISNSLNAGKVQKEDRKTITTEAVTFERDKKNRKQHQEKEQENPDNNESENTSENLVYVKETKGVGKKIDILV